MIHVEKDYRDIPEGLCSARICKEIRGLLTARSGDRFKREYYRHTSVKNGLEAIYGTKCAYCESYFTHVSYKRIDHYRPIKKYFWIGYEWSNLLLTCEVCNGSKSAQFPIEGTPVTEPQTNCIEWLSDSATFRAEKPLLLNPEVDAPEEHLQFYPDGEIAAKNRSRKGSKTIFVCKLNREELYLQRRRVVARIRKKMKARLLIIINQRKKGIIRSKGQLIAALESGFFPDFSEIEAASHPGKEFSLLGKYMKNRFHRFFIDPLESNEQKKLIALAIHKFKKKATP